MDPSPLQFLSPVDEISGKSSSTIPTKSPHSMTNSSADLRISAGLRMDTLRTIAEMKMRRETRRCVPRLERMLAHVTILENLDNDEELPQIKPVDLSSQIPEGCPPSYEEAVEEPAPTQLKPSSEFIEYVPSCKDQGDQLPELHLDDSSSGSDSDPDELWSEDESTLERLGHGTAVLTVDEEDMRPEDWAQLVASCTASKGDALNVDVRECGEDDT